MSEVWSEQTDAEQNEDPLDALRESVEALKLTLQGRVDAVYCQNPIAIVVDINAFQSPKGFKDLARMFKGCAIIVKRPGSSSTFIDSAKHSGVMGDALELFDKNLITKQDAALDVLFGSGSSESATGADNEPRETPEA